MLSIPVKSITAKGMTGIMVFVWVAAAWSKGHDPWTFRRQVEESITGPGVLSLWVTWAVPATELVIAYLLAVPAVRRLGLVLGVGLLIVFTGFLIHLLTRPETPGCGCFGSVRMTERPKTELILGIVRNSILIFVSLVGLWCMAARTGASRAGAGRQANPGAMRGLGAARTGFTLTELLVVIGVIALLLAISLPVLASIRSAASASRCLSSQRNVHQAAMVGAHDRLGHSFLAGDIPFATGLSNDQLPGLLNDSEMRRYVYWRPSEAGLFSLVTPLLAPFPFILIEPNSVAPAVVLVEEWDNLYARTHPRAKGFMCTDASSAHGSHATRYLEYGSSAQPWAGVSGYALNGHLFGVGGLRGRLAAVRDASQMLMLADADLRPSVTTIGVWVAPESDPTLHGALQMPRVPQLDQQRHGGRCNVLFADGHARTYRFKDAELRRLRIIQY